MANFAPIVTLLRLCGKTTNINYKTVDSLTGQADNLPKGETEGEVWSSLGGIRIAKPTKKGLYIRNNKKVVVQ